MSSMGLHAASSRKAAFTAWRLPYSRAKSVSYKIEWLSLDQASNILSLAARPSKSGQFISDTRNLKIESSHSSKDSSNAHRFMRPRVHDRRFLHNMLSVSSSLLSKFARLYSKSCESSIEEDRSVR